MGVNATVKLANNERSANIEHQQPKNIYIIIITTTLTMNNKNLYINGTSFKVSKYVFKNINNSTMSSSIN
jgi:hypothetical protein